MKYGKMNPLQYDLPKSAQLTNGTWVSNYHLLPADVLAAEGWLPLEEVYPEYNPETHYMVSDTVVETDGKIVVSYKTIPLPPDEIDLLLDELEAEL
jgi:hypothetical protein